MVECCLCGCVVDEVAVIQIGLVILWKMVMMQKINSCLVKTASTDERSTKKMNVFVYRKGTVLENIR